MKVNRHAALTLWNEYKKLGIEEEFRRVIQQCGVEKFMELPDDKKQEVFLYLSDFLFGIKHGAYSN